MAKFLREIDPDNKLPEAERQSRAEAYRRAYMKRMALERERRRKERRPAAEGNQKEFSPLDRLNGGDG